MTDELDLRLSAAFRSLDLPAADPRLADTLRSMRAAALQGRSIGQSTSRRPPRAALLGLAASVVVAVAVLAAVVRMPSIGPAPSPTPVPTPSPTAAPTPAPNVTSWPAFTVGTLLTARRTGDVGGEQVLVVGWWSDLRPDTACGTPSPSPLIIACGDAHFGLTDAPEPIGTWDGETFVPASGPAITPLLPAALPTPGLGRSLIGLRDADGNPHPPVLTTVVGRFDSPLADACPADLEQACRDRFVVEEIIWVEAGSRATPDPSAPAPDPDDPPPATIPSIVDTCRLSRNRMQALEEGDAQVVEIVSSGWVPFEELDVQPLTIEFMEASAPAWVYVVVTEPDVPIGRWTPDPAGSDRRFRHMGQAVCIGWGPTSGVFHSTVPGSTYELWDDGERVPLPEYPPPP